MPLMTIYGITFECPAPYAAGHTLSDVEAAELNRALADNIRNNLSKRAKAAQSAEPATKFALAGEFAAYAASYAFTRRAGEGHPSPIEREALRIAKATLREALQRRNETRAEDELDRLAAQIASSPAVRAEAERRVAKTLEIASSALDLGSELL